MFHAGGHKGINTRGRSSALSRHYPHFLSHVDWKAPLRCGILFCTFSCILFVVGIVLTWLGVHDMFGESVPITGPILLAVGGLMLILALRQFYMANIRKKALAKAVQGKELGVTAIIVEQDEEHDLTETEAGHQKMGIGGLRGSFVSSDDTSEKAQLSPGGYCDSSTMSSSCGDTLSSEGYAWPPMPLQHMYYSMAMMVYKDPLAVANTNRGMYEVGYAAGAAPTLVSSQLQQRDTAVLQTSSVTLQQQKNQSACSSPTSESGSRLECSKIFPADYLTSYQRSTSTNTAASAGISNLPNPTAFMMLRTLELQETI